ncbi:DUF1653 domain-containing protein [Alteromonas sp. C1M14]|uniref:DUF1653 domain-containing protein n=1 Tax=Alteromonas sp. C1M14 TaxID=2841567 RepID=UPI001C0870AC|nr:DUF1653 domain-containing protein [Alteromonas sp. C1M14]MBU2976643.1 DUF1653 domain-containing protein [Alteromonas sp. C1M14]
MPQSVKVGLYQHYKGSYYTVVGVAKHSEDETELVVYRPEYGDRSLWVRPLSMFVETVQKEGKPVPRFAYIGESRD